MEAALGTKRLGDLGPSSDFITCWGSVSLPVNGVAFSSLEI